MLGDIFVTLPINDMETAKDFYGKKLGLELVKEAVEGLYFKSGNTTLLVYPSQYAGTNQATAAGWMVADVVGTVESLKGKGVMFEQYDNLPNTTREGDVHIMGEDKAAWFKDPAGNILAISNV